MPGRDLTNLKVRFDLVPGLCLATSLTADRQEAHIALVFLGTGLQRYGKFLLFKHQAVYFIKAG